MSRSLKPTRPVSSRLILEPDALITSPASSSVIPRSSRSRRSWAPSSRRGTVGPPPAGAPMRRTTGFPDGTPGLSSG